MNRFLGQDRLKKCWYWGLLECSEVECFKSLARMITMSHKVLCGTSMVYFFSEKWENHVITSIDVLDQDSLLHVFNRVIPNVVISCIGLIKQISISNDLLAALSTNLMVP